MNTDTYLERAARIRVLAERDLMTIVADPNLERDDKLPAAMRLIDRARLDLEQLAAEATSQAAADERRLTLELAAFGQPANELAVDVDLGDNPQVAVDGLRRARVAGNQAHVDRIVAAAWIACLNGRPSWRVVIEHALDGPKNGLLRALLGLLTRRDRAAEIQSFLPAVPSQLTRHGGYTTTSSPA